MNHLDTDFAYIEKAWRQLDKDASSYIKQILKTTSHKLVFVRPLITHLEENPN